MMRRTLALSLVAASLSISSAFADPGISVFYRDESLRVTLDGSYVGAYYRVWRSGKLLGQYDPLASQYTLCTGDCFVTDQQATPGRTYYYEFEMQTPQGELITYGPYAVTVPDTPLSVRVWPNPARGPVSIDLSLPGSRRRDAPLEAEARVLDAQGRVIRNVFSGTVVRGITSLRWDGRNESGQTLGAGVYFVRVVTPLGSSTTRLTRIR
jgi:hypothetical protein